MSLPHDYVERVYAGVLGKLIGVYLGRPFEGWPYERIMDELGPIYYYVNDQLNRPLVITDDDISGTFTFLRALPDYGNSLSLSPADIGQTWLNYIIENKTILWWGGMGNSTEHTAFLRLKQGIRAPHSGSRKLNGKVVSEQIGAQIFIDGWGMVFPGNPHQAAEFARRAASVSHDGEAIFGAQVVAAMVAMAFVETDINKLLNTAVSLIPRESITYRLISDIREQHVKESDWEASRAWLAKHYGYDTYGGNCHIIPNHGLIILSLLYGKGDFQESLMIVNTSGWDTDCNSGNVGCILGIRNGLEGISKGPDWRGPIADRLYLPTADGGRSITDAVTETFHVVNIGRALAGEEPLTPKNGARFHFELPGSAQGFLPDMAPDTKGTMFIENVVGFSETGKRSLALRYRGLAKGRRARAKTATFTPVEAMDLGGYSLIASPTLYVGQTVSTRLSADMQNLEPITVGLYVQTYNSHDQLVIARGPTAVLNPGESRQLDWTLDLQGTGPIAEVGIELTSEQPADGSVYLDYLTWGGSPDARLAGPGMAGRMTRRAWVEAVDHLSTGHRWRMIQNFGQGMIIQGTRDWKDYEVVATVSAYLAGAIGIAARCQGLQRYYALTITSAGKARLTKILDGEHVLDERDLTLEFDRAYELRLRVKGPHLQAQVDGEILFEYTDQDRVLDTGAVGLLLHEGNMDVREVSIRALR